jgi:hypothetical protein
MRRSRRARFRISTAGEFETYLRGVTTPTCSRMPTNTRQSISLLICICSSLVMSGRLKAQSSGTTTLDFATGSGFEDYLRLLQVAGLAEVQPWSIRGLAPQMIAKLASADSAGPWALRTNFNNGRIVTGRTNLTTTINTSFPYGANDGPVWAGRGITIAGSGGIAARIGPVSAAFSPTAFVTTNAPFDLIPNGESGRQVYNNAEFPNTIDDPQRFGNKPYSRLDPDASSIRVDSRFISMGASTGNEWIGPATEYPFLLSTNAPGFPHLFVGTGDPVNLWLTRLQLRVIWGKLYQSDFAPVSGSVHFVLPGSGTVRLMASSEVVLLPRGFPGLELGFARFLHVPYRAGDPTGVFWRKPFKAFFLKNEYAAGDSLGVDNQLASAFFRWVFPRSGFELYGERGYEDQFYDFRDFIQDPDNEREYMLGFQKTFSRGKNSLDVLKMEVLNYQLPTLARVRVQGLVYVHAMLRQGHTNRGQLLGASAGAGAAAASTISWTRYTPEGRSTFLLRRIVQDQANVFAANGTVTPARSDVIISAGAERMRFGRRVDWGEKVELMEDFNHNAKNIPNLNIQFTARLHSR